MGGAKSWLKRKPLRVPKGSWIGKHIRRYGAVPGGAGDMSRLLAVRGSHDMPLMTEARISKAIVRTKHLAEGRGSTRRLQGIVRGELNPRKKAIKARAAKPKVK